MSLAIELTKPVRFFTAEDKVLTYFRTMKGAIRIEPLNIEMMSYDHRMQAAVKFEYERITFFILLDELEPAAQKRLKAFFY